VREAEAALRDLGYHRTRSSGPRPLPTPSFWVHGPRSRTGSIPVYVNRPEGALPAGAPANGPEAETHAAILVVPTDAAAESAWRLLPSSPGAPSPTKLSILVLRDPRGNSRAPHWHLLVAPPKEVLRLATGIVVGMYHRAFAGQAGGDIDFGELLATLRAQYHVDVQKSLGVESDEDALFILYHLALRDTFAPGNIAGNIHSIVANPTGPASRIPWFAG